VFGREPLQAEEDLREIWAKRIPPSDLEAALETYRRRELEVRISDNKLISRVHAMIRPRDGGYEVVDLHSLNGTYIDGNPLAKGVPTALRANTTLSLIGGDEGVFAHVYFVNNTPEYHALIVANPQGDDAVRTRTAKRLGVELEKRGFAVTYLTDQVTTDNLDTALERVAGTCTQDQTFVFAYSGHGSRSSGLCLHGGEYSAKRLFRNAKNIRGRQLYLIDACHSAGFLHHRDKPTRAAVLTSTEDEGKRSARCILLDAFTTIVKEDPHRLTIDNALVAQLGRTTGYEHARFDDQQPGLELSRTQIVIRTQRY
jgi:hypothetical protein